MANSMHSRPCARLFDLDVQCVKTSYRNELQSSMMYRVQQAYAKVHKTATGHMTQQHQHHTRLSGSIITLLDVFAAAAAEAALFLP